MRKSIKLVREGNFAAEVSVEMIEEGGGWSPYISASDARKLREERFADSSASQ